MDLIRDSGMHVAEAVTRAPDDQAPNGTYYYRGAARSAHDYGRPDPVPPAPGDATIDDLDAYLDHLFEAVAPGRRIIFGRRHDPAQRGLRPPAPVGQRVAEEGRLPIEAGAFRPVRSHPRTTAAARTAVGPAPRRSSGTFHADVLTGDPQAITPHVQALLDGSGVDASDILHLGMLRAMEVIGGRFRDGAVFIPEVLMSARAMNDAIAMLEPHLSRDKTEAGGKVLLGTVRGDLHDIGKNIVATMLRGVGFEVGDLGINVRVNDFVKQVQSHRPDMLGMSALLPRPCRR